MVSIAQTFGSTAHVSPLLRKVRRLGFGAPEDLLRLAAARGCHHYMPIGGEVREGEDPGLAVLGDEELGVAMISGSQVHDPRLIRCAAQLLSGSDISASKLARLACMERCVPLLAYIAFHAIKGDLDRRDFWSELLQRLPPSSPVASDQWPHPSRFVIQSGYKRGGGAPAPIWLRPRRREASR
jgi:hypothetical protein